MFGFSYNGKSEHPKGLGVVLCEEVFSYPLHRKNGVGIVGNIILQTGLDDDAYLGIWHRSNVGSFDVSGTDALLDPDDFYTHAFMTAAPNRASIAHDRKLRVKLFEDGPKGPQLTSGDTEVFVPQAEGLKVMYPVREKIAEMGEALPTDCEPFTYAEIGPFGGKGQHHAIRVKAHIGENALKTFTFDDVYRGIRTFEAYGIDEFAYRMSLLDLPVLSDCCKQEVFQEYEKSYHDMCTTNKISPRHHSIIAVDSHESTGYQPNGLYWIELRKGTKDLSSHLPKGFFEHEQLEGVKGVFWFVNQGQNQSFRLQFKGPMAD